MPATLEHHPRKSRSDFLSEMPTSVVRSTSASVCCHSRGQGKVYRYLNFSQRAQATKTFRCQNRPDIDRTDISRVHFGSFFFLITKPVQKLQSKNKILE